MREIFTLSWLGFSETYWWLPKISDNFLKTSEHCQSLVNAGHLLGFIPVEKAFGKTFRIMRFDRRKCGKVVKKDLHKNFGVKFMFFCFCSLFGLLDWIVLVLFPLHKLDDKVVLDTSQAVEGMWIRLGSYWQLRGEWVRIIIKLCVHSWILFIWSKISILNCNVDLKNVTCRVHIEYWIMCHNKIIFKVREGSLEALAYILF